MRNNVISNDYLFVYGTLRSEIAPEVLKKVIAAWRRVGAATIKGRLYDLGDYPGLALDLNDRSLIRGEVFELNCDLKLIDDYEGYDPEDPHDSLFIRERVEAELDNDRRLECWVYVYHRSLESAERIESGDYLQHHRNGYGNGSRSKTN